MINLRTPGADGGYNRRNPVRTEDAAQAAELDRRILAAWSAHPRRFVVETATDFLTKLVRAVDLVRDEVPACCRADRLRAAPDAVTPAATAAPSADPAPGS